jgi:hypothetical protein
MNMNFLVVIVNAQFYNDKFAYRTWYFTHTNIFTIKNIIIDNKPYIVLNLSDLLSLLIDKVLKSQAKFLWVDTSA